MFHLVCMYVKNTVLHFQDMAGMERRLVVETDFIKCCFCQGKERHDDIRHPYAKAQHHSSYQRIEEDVLRWSTNAVPLPYNLDPKRLDDGSGIANTLLRNNTMSP